jgi:hypothetical protein
MMDEEIPQEVLTDGEDETKTKVKSKLETEEAVPVCTECKIVHTSKGICEDCRTKPRLTPDEQTYLDRLMTEISYHKIQYDERKKNPPEGWDYSKDKDYWGRRMKIHELSEFGKKKGIWIWDGVEMYSGYKEVKP